MHRVKGVAFRYWSAELLPGELEGVGSDLAVTSPELTLLMLASKVSASHLALMMSEMCGGFSSVHLSEEDAEAVRMGVQQGVFAYAGWAPLFTNERGMPDARAAAGSVLSDLWQRDALTSRDKLRTCAKRHAGVQVIERFTRALDDAVEGARSPFEVQTAILLTLPRNRGGEGFELQGMNVPVTLSKRAREILDQERCYIDLLFSGPEGCPGVAVECQGRSVHGTSGQAVKDVRRVAALEAMGYRVLSITYDMISNAAACHQMVHLLAEKMGVPYRDKTEFLLKKEIDLRAELFCEWNRLGMMPASKRGRR